MPSVTDAIDFLCESSPLFSHLSSRLESGVFSFPFVTTSDCDVLVAMIVVPCQSVQGKPGPYHVTVPLPEGLHYLTHDGEETVLQLPVRSHGEQASP